MSRWVRYAHHLGLTNLSDAQLCQYERTLAQKRRPNDSFSVPSVPGTGKRLEESLEYQVLSISRLRPILVAVASLALISSLGYSMLLSLKPHPSVGRWRSGLLVISIDPDGVATVNGVICEWRKVNIDTIRIQPKGVVKTDQGFVDTAFYLTVEGDGKDAVAEIFGYPMAFTRLK